MVFQAHRTFESSQLWTGRFRENLQVAGKRQEAFGIKSAKGVLSRGVYTMVDRAWSLYNSVKYYQSEDWLGR